MLQTIIEYLKQQDWGFWEVMSAIIIAIISGITFLVQRKKKELSFLTVSNTTILSEKTKLEGKVKVFFENEIIENLHIVIFQFTNTGNEAIVQKDFDSPILLALGESSEIISVEIEKCKPDSLNVRFEKTKNSISIQALLLNKGDSFEVKILLKNYYDKELKLTARIKDISEVKNGYKISMFTIIFFSLGIISLFYGLIFVQDQSLEAQWDRIKQDKFIFIGLILMALSLFNNRGLRIKLLKNLYD
jgi:hypothetical protein